MSYYFISSVFFIGFVTSINRYYDVITLLTHCTLTSACFIRRIIGGRDEKKISVAIYSSPFTLLLGNEHRVALCLCETVKIQPLKTTPQLQSHPSPAHPPSPRDSLPREGEREGKG